MKIREIIDLTKQGKNISQIAKEHLPCGEKKSREILVSLGAEKPISGSRSGWDYGIIGADVLEKDISEFITKKATAKSRQTQKSTKKENNNNSKTEKHDIINPNLQESRGNGITENQPTNKMEYRQFEQTMTQETRRPTKKVTYEIDEDLHFEYRMLAFRQKRNVSELVEQAMKEFLDK
jgi:hypothetical protein